MASVNKVVLVGHVGADPEVRTLPSGDPVANVSVATSDRRPDGKGAHVETTEWHRVAVYGKQADVVRQYVRKGTQVYVEGKLRTSVWKDRERGGAQVVVRRWRIACRIMLGSSGNARSSRRRATGQIRSTGWMDSRAARRTGIRAGTAELWPPPPATIAFPF